MPSQELSPINSDRIFNYGSAQPVDSRPSLTPVHFDTKGRPIHANPLPKGGDSLRKGQKYSPDIEEYQGPFKGKKSS